MICVYTCSLIFELESFKTFNFYLFSEIEKRERIVEAMFINY